MLYQLKLQIEAIEDIQQAYEWYELQKLGLGDVFIDELSRSFDRLSLHPEHYGLVNKWIRRTKINKFPFIVAFEIENDTIIVVSVLHTSRKPKF